jgi:Reverse transcriptase (RNA-dependent DNA polymerase)
VFDVKHDGRHKARLVADGHLTNIPLDSVYSGVVSLRGFRLVLVLAELNDLQLWATDIGNAYLEAYTAEKVYIIAGPEFEEREGHILVISKALYSLRSSGARWHDRFADCIRKLGFFPCKAEPDIWLRKNGNIYKYIAVYVDVIYTLKAIKSVSHFQTQKGR